MLLLPFFHYFSLSLPLPKSPLRPRVETSSGCVCVCRFECVCVCVCVCVCLLCLKACVERWYYASFERNSALCNWTPLFHNHSTLTRSACLSPAHAITLSGLQGQTRRTSHGLSTAAASGPSIYNHTPLLHSTLLLQSTSIPSYTWHCASDFFFMQFKT